MKNKSPGEKPEIKIGQCWIFRQHSSMRITIKNKSMNHISMWGVKWNNIITPGTLSTSAILSGFYLSEESIVTEVLSKYGY